MRRVTVHWQRSSTLEIAMTPMIDVVFLLLVFFLWSSSFQRPEESLPSVVTVSKASGTSAPEIPPPPEKDFEEVIIRIHNRSDTPYQVNDVPIATLAMLDGYLGQLSGIHREAPLIVHPDEDVPLASAIEVYDVARRHGFLTAFAAPIVVDQ